MRYFDPDDHLGFAAELIRLVELNAAGRYDLLSPLRIGSGKNSLLSNLILSYVQPLF